MKAGFILVAMCVAASAGAAQLYQWKDAQGRMVYSDQPPPPSVKNAQQKAFKGSVIEGTEAYAVRLAHEKNPVTLYASACGTPCDLARTFLTDRGVRFGSRDPQASPDAQLELQKLTGRQNVPVLVIGSEKIDGFEIGAWDAALDRAGYPKPKPSAVKPAPAPATAPAAPTP
ncbi:MAG: glutaredoxin family protein [Hydrogenophilales bacterium 16-64-46]|nr:MAG: glutaredoxin family protein [Hydrogenophilales bacterium 12-64-13]OYZ07024.1 MAG: glutaredoxin family protein [Hydrogenophilales bacterium 16-64-46]OZA37732.1 MAG: glutaredoxin family protein [Hydrogenophilales bacterium 17-64-34]HQS99318.1 glutaredoxin family protein [Thiobacillus sp.]